MIQNNLYKAKMMTADIETVIHCELDDIKSKVERVYKSAGDIKDVINSNILSEEEKIYNINYLASRIMALTQGLE